MKQHKIYLLHYIILLKCEATIKWQISVGSEILEDMSLLQSISQKCNSAFSWKAKF